MKTIIDLIIDEAIEIIRRNRNDSVTIKEQKRIIDSKLMEMIRSAEAKEQDK